MNTSHRQPQPAKKTNNLEKQTNISHPNDKELIRIQEIAKELAELQEKQNALIKELGKLAPEVDPPGIEWIYPDSAQQETETNQS